MLYIYIIIFVIILPIFLFYIHLPILARLVNLTFSIFVHNPPIMSIEDKKNLFPEAKILEKNWKIVRKEALMLMKYKTMILTLHEINKYDKRISKRSGGAPWRTFFFKIYGNWVEKNCKLCPKTIKLLKRMPNITTAMFSILDGKKHIPPHYGPYKGVFRYHLGLLVPKDKSCFIVVGGKRYNWKEGEGVLFDDSYNHHVYNNSKNPRIVLFLDVYRTDFPYPLNKINQIIYNFIKNSKLMKNNYKKAEVQIEL